MKKMLSIVAALLLLSSGLAQAQTSASSAGSGSGEPGAGRALLACTFTGGANVLIVQTSYPWNSDADLKVLNQIGKTYDCVSSVSQLATLGAAVFNYKVILIVNDQVQAFYDAYAANLALITQYVTNGGTLLIFAAGGGWAGGLWNGPLPGGEITLANLNVVGFNGFYDQANHIVDPSHPIVTGLTPGGDGNAINDTEMAGNYTSHGYFIPGTLVQTKNLHTIFQTLNIQPAKPTFITYDLGSGHVVATTMTQEFSYDRGVPTCLVPGGGCVGIWSLEDLDDIFRFALTQGQVLQGNCLITAASYSPVHANPGNTITLSATTNNVCASVWVLTDMARPAGADPTGVPVADLAAQAFFAMQLTPDQTGTSWSGTAQVPMGFPQYNLGLSWAGVGKVTGNVDTVWPVLTIRNP